MVLITSAQYCSADFMLEFGQIVPSFLPLGGRRLYEFQRRLFEGEELVLALPHSFQMSLYDVQKLESLSVRILRVPDGLRLGEMVVYCINVLNVNENFTILHGDTYFQKFSIVPDSVQVAKVKENYNWTYLDEDFCLRDLNFDREGKILAGGFCFSKPRILVKNIVCNDYSFANGIRDYSKEFALLPLENEAWFDFGLITNYFCSKQIFTTQRSFNALHFEKGFCIKTSKMQGKIEAEAAWFENLPRELLLFVPRFLRLEKGYKSEYFFHNSLAELFVFGSLPDFVWKKIFESLKEFLELMHNFKSKECLNFDYKSKTLERFSVFSNSSISAILRLKFQVCGEELDAFELVERLSIYLKTPCEFSLIHGDLCFSNVMYDFRAERVRVYDPRGMDFSDKVSSFGDRNYDLAKLTHSIFGLYDFIIYDFYEFSQDGELVFHDNVKSVQKAFLEVFSIDDNIKAITIHLFLSMLPLHADNPKRQRAFLANAFRLYELFFGDKVCK